MAEIGGERPPAEDPLAWPAGILIALWVLALAADLALLAGSILDQAYARFSGDTTQDGILWLNFLVVHALFFFCAVQMKRHRRYPAAVAAACGAVIPCVSPFLFLGIPVGIWALVLLLKRDVRATFAKKPPSPP